MWPSPQFPVDLVQLTEEIHNEKRHFLFASECDFPEIETQNRGSLWNTCW